MNFTDNKVAGTSACINDEEEVFLVNAVTNCYKKFLTNVHDLDTTQQHKEEMEPVITAIESLVNNRRSETVTIVGEMGVGKSTLIDHLMCLGECKNSQYAEQIVEDGDSLQQMLDFIR